LSKTMLCPPSETEETEPLVQRDTEATTCLCLSLFDPVPDPNHSTAPMQPHMVYANTGDKYWDPLDYFVYWLWKPWGEGVDEYQAEAVRQWRRGVTYTGCDGNPYSEYPRISRRFPRGTNATPCNPGLFSKNEGQCLGQNHWWRWLEATFLPDTISENLYSSIHASLLFIMTINFVILGYSMSAFKSASDFKSFGTVFETTIYYLYLLGIFTLLSLLMLFTRIGANVHQPHLILIVSFLFGASIYQITREGGIYHIQQWTTDCSVGCSTTMHMILWLTAVVCHGMMLGMDVLVAMKLIIPLPLVRRRYNYRYLMELLSPKRRQDERAEDGKEIPTAWELLVADANSTKQGEARENNLTFYGPSHGSAMTGGWKQMDDLQTFVQRMKANGISDKAIIREIIRMDYAEELNSGIALDAVRIHEETNDKALGKCLGVKRAPFVDRTNHSKTMSMLESIAECIWPGMDSYKNPHAKIKWCTSIDEPGNIRSEMAIMPMRIQAAFVVILFLTVLGTALLFLYAHNLWGCYLELSNPNIQCGIDGTGCKNCFKGTEAFWKNVFWFFRVTASGDGMQGLLHAAQTNHAFADSIYISFNSAAGVSGVFGLWSVFRVLQGYRETLYDIREQKVMNWNFDPSSYVPYDTTQYIASYTIYNTAAMGLVTFLFFIISMSLAWDPLWNGLWVKYLWPFLLGILFTKIWLTGIVKIVFYNKFVTQDNSVVWRKAFLFLELPLTMFQVIMSLYAALMRVVYSLVLALVSLFRVDVTTLPMGLEGFDSAFSGFVACIYMHEKHCGPIITEFVDSLCCPREPLQGIGHLRRDVDAGRVTKQDTIKKLEAAEEAMKRRLNLMDSATGLARVEAADEFTLEDNEALKPFFVARNRWHMALTLLKNPSLMKYRCHRLPKIP